MRQLMAELFIVATKADVLLIKILQQNNVDGDQLTEDELVMYNFAVVSSGSSRPIVYSKKMLLEFKGNVDAVNGVSHDVPGSATPESEKPSWG